MFIGHSFLTDCECFCRETKHVPFICMLTLQTGPKGSVCFFIKVWERFILLLYIKSHMIKQGRAYVQTIIFRYPTSDEN